MDFPKLQRATGSPKRENVQEKRVTKSYDIRRHHKKTCPNGFGTLHKLPLWPWYATIIDRSTDIEFRELLKPLKGHVSQVDSFDLPLLVLWIALWTLIFFESYGNPRLSTPHRYQSDGVDRWLNGGGRMEFARIVDESVKLPTYWR
ncbi:hypothetical protein F5890DRAFT_1476912 [Lentinula detonsa]|uniref:Uncharacterized protein n=1 Tax=Lentinula detonsa TaxID=2804962 RepID=A0AA38PTR0_9AGAR|nr:hypothetical protein F5890DRAFT_1476912 [Lentinula detonsa]